MSGNNQERVLTGMSLLMWGLFSSSAGRGDWEVQVFIPLRYSCQPHQSLLKLAFSLFNLYQKMMPWQGSSFPSHELSLQDSCTGLLGGGSSTHSGCLLVWPGPSPQLPTSALSCTVATAPEQGWQDWGPLPAPAHFRHLIWNHWGLRNKHMAIQRASGLKNSLPVGWEKINSAS